MKRILLPMLIATFFLVKGTAQNTLPVFPCYGQPKVGNTCPNPADAPAGYSQLIGVDDYYDVYVEGVCVDQPDSWWKNKLVHVSVTITIGTVSSTVPVYADRTGKECHLGVANFPLLTSVPANGQKLSISAQVNRADDNDGLRKILGFLSAEQKDTTLSTYASSAVPYLTAASAVGSQVYNTFANHSEVWLNFKPMVLSPKADVSTRFDLTDEFLVQYAGPNAPSDSSVYVDDPSFELMWGRNNPVRGGSTWIVYRVQKYTHRQDYPQRPWYTQWKSLMQQARFRQINADSLQKRVADVVAVLMADMDYTNGDKEYYQKLFIKNQAEMVTFLNTPNADPDTIRTAFDNAIVEPQVYGLDVSSGIVVTSVNSSRPVVSRAYLEHLGKDSLNSIISPENLLQGLHEANGRATPQ